MENEKALTRVGILLTVLLILSIGGAIGYYYYFYLRTPSAGTETAKGQKTYDRAQVIVGLHGDITGIFPKNEDDEFGFTVSRHMFDPLVSLDKNMQIQPVLADGKSWTNPDTNTWRFKLKKNVKFHDGTAFSAEDIKFSIEQSIKNEWSSAAYLATVDSVSVVDENTVDIKTKGPDPVLLNSLANVLIVAKNYSENSNEPNGTGPYKFVEWVKGDHITLTANTSYHGNIPKVKKAVFKIIEDEKARVSALLRGQIDLAFYGIEENATSQIQANQNLQVKSTPSLAVTVLILNTEKENSPFKDIKVRKAFYKALDVQKLIAKNLSGGESATQLVTKSIFGFNPQIKRLPYNFEEAKDLLSEAGMSNGLEVTLDTAKGSESVDQEIVDQLSKVGIKVTLNVMDRNTIAEKIFKNRDTLLMRSSWSEDTGDSASGMGALLHKPDEAGIYGMLNFGYSNQLVDEALDNAAKTLDQKGRQPYLQEAMKLAMDDVAAIPLYAPNYQFGLASDIVWDPRPNRQIFAFEMASKNPPSSSAQ